MRDILNELQLAIEHETCRVIGARFHLENQNNERDRRMAIEIKGLKAKAIKAGTVFERLNRAYDKLIETGEAHAGDVESLAPQLTAMQDDISFAVATLGNSVNGTGEAEKPVEKPKDEAARTDRVALGPHPDQPEVAPAPLSNGSAASTEPAA